MGLAEARKRAQEALLQVASGQDPAAAKQRSRTAYGDRLFGPLARQFIENYAKRKTRGWRETERLLYREFVTPWERWPIDTVSRQDVQKLLQAIVDRGSPSAANHALAVIRKMFNWAIEQGHIDRSPCLGIRAPSKLKVVIGSSRCKNLPACGGPLSRWGTRTAASSNSSSSLLSGATRSAA